jgi:Predicted RNA binding protein (contains ribosomal protein S1 domain)
MQLEVGAIQSGKVTGIKNFGAFVELTDGTVGMVHISEVANSYVKDLQDFLQEGQEVKVKVLSISPEGKISLSIKQAEPIENSKPKSAPPPNVWKPKPVQNEDPTDFEGMMAKFKQQSEEKIADVKRNKEAHRGSGGGYSHRGGRG